MNFIIIFSAKYLLFLLILLAAVVVLLAKRDEQKYLAKIAIISFPLSYIIAKISAHFIYNPRPFVVEHVKPLIPHAVNNGFPSDHTLLAMAIASVLFVYNRKLGIIFAILGLIVGFSRVLANVHHTLDILGSSVIAIVSTYIAWWLINKFLKSHN